MKRLNFINKRLRPNIGARTYISTVVEAMVAYCRVSAK